MMHRVLLASLSICGICSAAGPTTRDSAPTSEPSPPATTLPHGRPMKEKVPADFVEHKLSEDEGAILKVPPKWTEQKGHGNVTLNVIADDGQSSVNVVVVGPAGTDDPEVLSSAITKALANQVHNFVLKKSEIVDVDYVPSARIVYEGDMQGSLTLRWQQTVIPQIFHTYIITYTAPVDHFDKYAKVVDQIVSSYYLPR
jgi:hypothetical protein